MINYIVQSSDDSNTTRIADWKKLRIPMTDPREKWKDMGRYNPEDVRFSMSNIIKEK